MDGQFAYGKRWGRVDPNAYEGLRECEGAVNAYTGRTACFEEPRWRDRTDYRLLCTKHKKERLAEEKASGKQEVPDG